MYLLLATLSKVSQLRINFYLPANCSIKSAGLLEFPTVPYILYIFKKFSKSILLINTRPFTLVDVRPRSFRPLFTVATLLLTIAAISCMVCQASERISSGRNFLSSSRRLVYISCAMTPGVTISFAENTMILIVDGKNVYINVTTQKKTEMYNLPNAATFNVGMFAVNSAGIGLATALQQVTTQ